MEFAELQEWAQQERHAQTKIRVHCCTSTGCRASSAIAIQEAMDKAVQEAGLENQVQVVGVGCMGFCGQGPMVEVVNREAEENAILYEQVTPEQAPSIIDAIHGGTTTAQRGEANHPFFRRQLKIVRENSGTIDPERLADYIAVGGYQALHRSIFELTPEKVV